MKITSKLLKAIGFKYHKANDCWYYANDYEYRLSDSYREIKVLKDLIADMLLGAKEKGSSLVKRGLRKILEVPRG
jgi:hypothetical protein